MNTNKLKTYAQTARREFIEAVTERAHYYGLKENSIVPCEVKGDFTIINGCAFPRRVDEQRRALEEQVNRKGFSQVIEEVAYTWFNRFAAIRYMELHGFLSHGYRVLSHPEGNSIPEILEKAQHVELLGLDKEEVIKLKMDGTKDEELYSKLLIAECNELSKAMPFLFERVQDYTELLFPDNLLHSDSIIRKLVNEIDDEDWQEVEIIGWLYQFYISEKKDEVIGKVVKSEDIPAATQLFTPNWIVKYLVQNSLGAQWMRTYPDSALKARMEYYIEPAEQTDEVNAKVKEITPETLNPEELTLLDPACGSGHILVEAYDLLKEIYLERGYRKRDIPEFILTKNLYGLEIDDRAAQLAGFAIMMKARADDRNILDSSIQPNIVSIQEMSSDDIQRIINDIASGNNDATEDIRSLLNLFEHGKTFGSLIRIPEKLSQRVQEIDNSLNSLSRSDNLFTKKAVELVIPFVQQTKLISQRYDTVVANPPYMGSKGMNTLVKDFAKKQYPDTKSDLFAMFIERGFEMTKQDSGNNAMVTMQSWMFLSSYEKMREKMFGLSTIRNMVHMSNGVMGIAFGTSATIWINEELEKYRGSFSFVDYSDLVDESIPREFPVENDRLKEASADNFKKIPGSPVAYWISGSVFDVFSTAIGEVRDFAEAEGKNVTTDNERFIRYWWEVRNSEVGRSPKRWFSFAKGGPYRKWFGNELDVVDWSSGALDHYRREPAGRLIKPKYWYLKGITWSKITSSRPSFRLIESDQTYQEVAILFTDENDQQLAPLLGLLNSIVAESILAAIAPTLNYQLDDICRVPRKPMHGLEEIAERVESLVHLAQFDSNSFELALNFQSLPILTTSSKPTPTLESSYTAWNTQNRDTIAEMKCLEEENNRLFIDAYGLADELTPDVPIEQITLTVNPAYRYGGKLREEEQWIRFRQDTMVELVSYSIGCMMGRYSLDQKGLVYAHAGNEEFDHNKYKTFPADDDGIVPITDYEWFDDDAACRFFRFIETAWDKDTLEDNLEFVADAIGRKTNESSRDSIRRYFINGFYKDHLKTYKKRPIYWMFTSGKEKAFQALVYLHRYNEGTLSRMRTEYVLPLQGKITTRMEHLEKDKDHASSTSAANKIQKEIGRLRKQKEELIKFDENLHHYADKKISLDIDDGVTVNYGKFGDLLAEVKAVPGKK